VITLFDNMQRHLRRDRREHGPKFIGRAERIALALDDQQRHTNSRKVSGPQLLGSAGRMQRIAEQHHAGDAERFGVIGRCEMRGDAASHRLAADEHRVAAEMPTRRVDGSAVARIEHVGPVRKPAALLGVQKVESHDVDAACGEPPREVDHERAVLSGAGAVREYERGVCDRGGRGIRDRARPMRGRAAACVGGLERNDHAI